MPNKKRRKQGQRRPRARKAPSAAPTAAERPRQARAERKEQARRHRETELRRIRRTRLLRRAAVYGGVLAIVLGALYLLQRVGGPNPISSSATRAADAAGCGDVQTPSGSAPGGIHLAPGGSQTYDQHPATSGAHDPSPLPAEPKVYTSPVPETNAVHNLEHGYVLLYYRAEEPDALPQDVIDSLTALAQRETKVILAPYPQLDQGTSFAVAAWNKLWGCPATVTAEQATAIATGLIDAFRGTSNAPEGSAA